MFLEKTSYPWHLKLGHQEIEVVIRCLHLASNSGNMTARDSEYARHLCDKIEGVMEEKLAQEREWEEKRDNKDNKFNRENRGRQMSYPGVYDDDDDEDEED